MKKDIIIVGGGPVGLYLTSLLEKDFDIVLIDRETPGHKTCSGLISKNLDNFIKIPEAVEHEVSSAVIHSPSGNKITFSKKSTASYVLNRKIFDKKMAENINTQITKDTAKSLVVENDRVLLKTCSGTFESDMLIGCDGSTSTIARTLKQKPNELLAGIAAYTNENNKDRNVDLFFDKRLVKDGFLWKIPRGETTEYGAMGSGIRFNIIEKFFSITDYKKESAPIPIGPCKTFSDRILLLGDAAGQVKPWSGGGIIFGFTAAGIAARTIRKSFSSSDFTERRLKEYEIGWKAAFGKEISFGLMGREMLKDMTNKELDDLFSEVSSQKNSHLDMDFPVFSSIG